VKRVDIYTDGACSGNPGPGGWGALLVSGSHEKEIYGGESATTNNRMELTAAVEALQLLKAPSEVHIHTDSRYLKDGVTQWIQRWQANGWRTSDKKAVKNEDLWRRLITAMGEHRVQWHWVRGHAGHVQNERADALARRGMAGHVNKSVG
jgi:ribonuclease HI